MITNVGDCIKGVIIGMFAALTMTALIDQVRQETCFIVPENASILVQAE